MKNSIKKVLCTAVAAMTIVSSSAAINKVTTGDFFSNSIIVEAAENKVVQYDDIKYRSDIKKVTYSKQYAKFYYKDGAWFKYKVKFYKKCPSTETSIVDGLKYVGVKNAKDIEVRYTIALDNGLVTYDEHSAYITGGSKVNIRVNENMLKLLERGKLIKKIESIEDYYTPGN